MTRPSRQEKRGFITLQRPVFPLRETTESGNVAIRTSWRHFLEIEVAILPILNEVLYDELGPTFVYGTLELKDIAFPSQESVWIVVAFEVTDVSRAQPVSLNHAAASAKALLAPEVRELFGFPTLVRTIVFE